MAVYEQTYKQYAGPLTPEWSRFLIIPRHELGNVFKSKLFTAFFVVCFVPLLVEAILIYPHHNTEALGIFKAQAKDLLPIDAAFFQTFDSVQCGFAFFLTVLVGPPLVARDLSHNGLPLYLCRPFSRAEYVFGKMCVVLILLSAVTWIPELLLFFFQAYLEGFSWLGSNLWLANAIFLSGLMWILLLSLLSQTVSAWVKWRVAASAALIGLYLIPGVFAEILTASCRCVGVTSLVWPVYAAMSPPALFGTFEPVVRATFSFDGERQEVIMREPPLFVCWLLLFLLCAFCLLLLSRKVKAYEVIR
jgi:ABC-type transport system involved in multi-copper enzyme maturation permease subunit